MTSSELSILIKVRDEASRVLDSVRGRAAGLGNTMRNVLRVGALGAAAGIGALALGLKSVVGEAAEAQRIQTQTNAVIESTRGVAGVSAAAVSNLANSLSRVIPIDDEVIQSTENVLLTFTKVGSDIFPKATEAILDMSTALGTDAQAAAIQVGKALNDPIRGMTALRRVGVSFTQAQLDTVKAMVEGGDAAGAQALILKELQVEFGGSARAAGDTFAGKMKILGTQIGNVKEAIGTALLPVLSRGADALANFVGDHEDDIRRLAEAVADKLETAFNSVVDFLTKHEDTIRGFAGTFKIGLDTIREGLEWVIDNKPATVAAITTIGLAVAVAFGPASLAIAAIVGLVFAIGLIRKNWEEIKTATERILGEIGATIDAKLGMWDEIITNIIGGIVGFFRENWATIKAIVLNELEFIKIIVTNALANVRDTFRLAGALLRGDWSEAWDILKGILTRNLDAIRDLVLNRLERIRLLFALGWAAVRDVTLGVVASLRDALAGRWREIVTVALAILFPPGAGLFALVTNSFGVRDRIVGAFSAIPGLLFGLVGRFFNAAKSLGSALLDGLKNALSATAGFAGDVATAVLDAIKSVINTFVIDKINSALRFTIKGPGPLPDFTIDAPDIPRLAAGMLNVPQDMLAFLHRGEMVLPQPIAAPLRSAGAPAFAAATVGGATINLNVTYTSPFGPSELERREFARDIGARLRRELARQ